ncbi:MAG TPA: hypothetical protein PKN62_03310, partial [bacterium]|nr:hypothetical protein [bacterium]
LEMHGQTPTIASLEKLSKFGKDLKANSRKHWQQLSAFGKILYFPFMLLGKLWEGLKKLWSKVWPIIRFIFGLFLIAGTFIGIIAIGTGSLYLLLQTYSDYRISFIPIADLISSIPFTLMVATGFLALAIPTILLLLAGISIVRRRSALTFTMAAILIAIWMVATIAGSALALNYVPEVVDRANRYPSVQQTSIKIDGNDAKELSVDGDIQILIDPQENKQASLEGRLVDLEGIEKKYENGKLTLTKKNLPEKKCFNCVRQNITLKIGGKNIEKLTANNGAYVGWANADQQFLTATSSYGAYVNINGKITDLKLNAVQANIVAANQDSQTIETSFLQPDSEISLSGKTKKLLIRSANTDKYVTLIANKLSSQDIEVAPDAPLTIIAGQTKNIAIVKKSDGILFHQNGQLNKDNANTWLITNYQPLDSFQFLREKEKLAQENDRDSISYHLIGNEDDGYMVNKGSLTADEFERMSLRFSSALNLDQQ